MIALEGESLLSLEMSPWRRKLWVRAQHGEGTSESAVISVGTLQVGAPCAVSSGRKSVAGGEPRVEPRRSGSRGRTVALGHSAAATAGQRL